MNHKVWNLLVLMSVYAGLVGCMDIRAVDKNKKPEEEVVVSTRLRALSTGEWNRFRILIPAGGGAAAQRSRVGANKVLERPELVRGAAGAVLYDNGVQAGETYVYEWSDGSGQTVRETIKVPVDLVVEGDVDFASESGVRLATAQEFGTLIFKDGTLVTTQEKDWSVRARQILIGADVRIRTFAPGQRAQPGSNGRSGGVILWVADRAEGEVHFELRGEGGGRGLDGPAPDEALKGRDGEEGLRPGGYLNGWHKIGYMDSGKMEYRCNGDGRMISLPTRGYTGQPGYQGRQGRNGGDTAELRLYVASGPFKSFIDSQEPGARGEGGDGGEGGAGGRGGKGFVFPRDLPSHSISENCQSVPDALPGARGPKGKPGDFGFAGTIRPVCIQQAGQEMKCF